MGLFKHTLYKLFTSSKHRLLWWLILLLLLPISKGLTSTAMFVLTGLSVLVLPAWWADKGLQAIKNIIQKPIVNWLLLWWAFYALMFISLLYTQNQENGWHYIEVYVPMLVIPFCLLINQKLIQQNSKLLLKTFIAGVGISSVATLIFYFLPEQASIAITNKTSLLKAYPESIDHEKFGLYMPFMDRLQFSGLLALGILTNFYLLLERHIKFKTKSYVLVGSFILLLFTLLILGGRGAQLSVFVSGSIISIWLISKSIYPKMAKQWGKVKAIGSLLTIGLLTISLGLISALYIPAFNQRITQTYFELYSYFIDGTYTQYDYTNYTTIRRILSWKMNALLIKNAGILGTGIGDYYDGLQLLYQKHYPNFPTNAHSQWLYYWACLGIPGLAFFITIFVSWGYWVLKAVGKQHPIFIWVISMLLYYVVMLCFDALLIPQTNLIAFILFGGISIIIAYTKNQST